jgi:F-type H+-transporting ATPase subunit delta
MAGAGARRYARAIFELAREEGEVDAWAQRLVRVRDVLVHPEARAMLTNPSIAAQRRQEAAATLLGDRAGPEGVNLAKLLVGAGRVADVDGIIEEYGRLADEEAGRVRATATTAVPLDGADAGRLVTALSDKLGREVRLDARVDPAILGGLVLQIGDRVIDASVATRLRQLRSRLVNPV